MEQPKQQPFSEDQQSEMKNLKSFEGNKGVFDVMAETYATKLALLKEQIEPLAPYITAKENISPAEIAVNRLFALPSHIKNASHSEVMQTLSILTSYQETIKQFEVMNNISSEQYTDLKEAYDDVVQSLKTLEDIQKVSEQTPSLN